MSFVDSTVVAPRTLIAERAVQTSVAGAGLVAGDPDVAPLLSILFHTMDEVRSLVVNLSAAHPGAGTSTVARRLAAAAAAGWCRVALIDAHPQPGGPDGEVGLVQLVEQGDNPVLTPTTIGNAAVDTGRLSTSTHTLPRIESVRRLYGTLRDRYSLVIVDCPAVLSGPQTLTIAAAADETVLVVEAERTALSDVARARAALERRGAGVLGMVMNKSRERAPRLFGRRP